MYTTSVQPESNFRCLKLIHLKMNSHNRKFTTLFLKIDQVHTICIAYEKRRNVNLMPMTIIFHHNSRIRSFVMVVNDYKVCSQILSINDFFCKFATTSLNQHYFLNIRIFVSYSLFCSYITQFRFFGQDELTNNRLPVRNFSKVGEKICNILRNFLSSALRAIYF